jgi:hypothetical protein
VPTFAIESVFGLVADGTVHVPDHDRLHPLIELRQVDYHGGFTAAAGCAIYTGRQFPPEYWNRCAFVCEPTGHLVHQCFLDPDPAAPSTFVARDGRNLLASWDDWCAPIAAEVGPDGAVWVLDWYSPVVQHNPTPHGFTTGKGNAYETRWRDKEHGRIWRIGWEEGEEGRAGGRREAVAATGAVVERRRLLKEMDRASAAAASAALKSWSEADGTGDRPLQLAATIVMARAWEAALPELLAEDSDAAANEVEGGAVEVIGAGFDEARAGVPAGWGAVGYGGIAVESWSEEGRAGGARGASCREMGRMRASRRG